MKKLSIYALISVVALLLIAAASTTTSFFKNINANGNASVSGTIFGKDGAFSNSVSLNGSSISNWPSGSGGTLAGPLSATDKAVARWNGIDGLTLQDSGVIVQDDGSVLIPASVFALLMVSSNGFSVLGTNATQMFFTDTNTPALSAVFYAPQSYKTNFGVGLPKGFTNGFFHLTYLSATNGLIDFFDFAPGTGAVFTTNTATGVITISVTPTPPMVGTISNNIVAGGIVAVDGTKTNAITPTLAMATNLFGMSGDTTKYLDASGHESIPPGSGSTPTAASIPIRDDMFSATAMSLTVPTGPLGLMKVTAGTGAAVTMAAATTTNATVGEIYTGTATTGTASVFADPGCFVFGGIGFTNKFRFRLTSLPDPTDSAIYRMGFSDATTNASVDGCQFRFTTNDTHLVCVSRANSVETAATNTTVVAANQWYVGKIVVASDATSVTFTIDGADTVVISSNIPSGTSRSTGLSYSVTKDAGTTGKRLQVDYIEVDYPR